MSLLWLSLRLVKVGDELRMWIVWVVIIVVFIGDITSKQDEIKRVNFQNNNSIIQPTLDPYNLTQTNMHTYTYPLDGNFSLPLQQGRIRFIQTLGIQFLFQYLSLFDILFDFQI